MNKPVLKGASRTQIYQKSSCTSGNTGGQVSSTNTPQASAAPKLNVMTEHEVVGGRQDASLGSNEHSKDATAGSGVTASQNNRQEFPQTQIVKDSVSIFNKQRAVNNPMETNSTAGGSVGTH